MVSYSMIALKMPRCIAITNAGTICVRTTNNGDRCGQHQKSYRGPYLEALHEMKCEYLRDIANLPPERIQARMDIYAFDRHQLLNDGFMQQMQHAYEERLIERAIREDRILVQQTGADVRIADALRVAYRRRDRNAPTTITKKIWSARLTMFGLLPGDYVGLPAIVDEEVAPPPADGEDQLRRFAGDAQNVHTSVIVKQTKDVVQKIREVRVPSEYAWNPSEASKTPFEIGLECKLSQRAALQMMSQYSDDTAIYDIEPGIYGKVLDSVWQFIKKSSDKKDLCKILKQELEDNIGMCAQGNLSRLCNILAGYMDGVSQKESTSEILGRLFPKLMEIEDEDIRVSKAVKILVEQDVPDEQWQTWLAPLRT